MFTEQCPAPPTQCLPRPIAVFFGDTPAAATLINTSTIRAIAPPHLPGPVEVTVYQPDGVGGLRDAFTYTGDPTLGLDAILLSVYTQPVSGAFGSLFATELRVSNDGPEDTLLFGFDAACNIPITCVPPNPFHPIGLGAGSEIPAGALAPNGRPGRVIYAMPGTAHQLSMTLRAFDLSRSATNFGTEMPVVRFDRFVTTPFTLNGVPGDARFRITLRLYSVWPEPVPVQVTVRGQTREVLLTGGTLPFEPQYAELSDFFTKGNDEVRVQIQGPQQCIICSPPIPVPRIWGFITVTNNETQHITTITPQPRGEM
jgi:hypothetical protein